MKSIFFIDTQIENPTIGDVTEYLREYPELNVNTAWAEIQTYTEDALRLNILPFIGKPLYDAIATEVQNEAILDEPNTEFLQLLRATVCYYAAMHFFPMKYTVGSSAGIGQNNPDKFTKASLPEYKISLWNITKTADRKLDLLLEFLETQVAEANADFDIWKNDPAYTRGKSPFFRNTADFQAYYNIFNSRPTFLALINAISDISDDVIQPILCDDLFLEIATQITESTLTEPNKKLLHLIRRAIAPLAVAKAAPRLLCIIEADGFKIASSSDGFNMTKAAIESRKEAVRIAVENGKAEGEEALNKLRKYLNDNLTDYPLYAESKCYKSAQARTKNFGVNVISDDGIGAYIFKKR